MFKAALTFFTESLLWIAQMFRKKNKISTRSNSTHPLQAEDCEPSPKVLTVRALNALIFFNCPVWPTCDPSFPLYRTPEQWHRSACLQPQAGLLKELSLPVVLTYPWGNGVLVSEDSSPSSWLGPVLLHLKINRRLQLVDQGSLNPPLMSSLCNGSSKTSLCSWTAPFFKAHSNQSYGFSA